MDEPDNSDHLEKEVRAIRAKSSGPAAGPVPGPAAGISDVLLRTPYSITFHKENQMKLKRWEIGILVAIVLGLASAGHAFFAYEEISVDGTAKTLTAATYQNANRALVTIETANVYFTFDGVTIPTTAGVGQLLYVGQSFLLEGKSMIRNFKVIRATSTNAKLKAHFWE